MYGKLFTSLYQGTLRGKPDEILVFTNLIAHADQHGCVDIHYQAISDEVGLPIERVKTAITNLESSDPESRSPEEDGKRLIPLDEHRAWGWHIVNYAKYRSIRNEDDRREQNRLAQQKWREKQKISKVSRVSHDKPMQKQKHIQIQEEEKTTEQAVFISQTLSALQTKLKLKKLPGEIEWIKQIEWAFSNDFTAEQFLGCFDLLNQQEWRTGAVSGKQVTANLPNLAKLRIEANQNGNNKPEPKLRSVADVQREKAEHALEPRADPAEFVRGMQGQGRNVKNIIR